MPWCCCGASLRGHLQTQETKKQAEQFRVSFHTPPLCHWNNTHDKKTCFRTNLVPPCTFCCAQRAFPSVFNAAICSSLVAVFLVTTLLLTITAGCTVISSNFYLFSSSSAFRLVYHCRSAQLNDDNAVKEMLKDEVGNNKILHLGVANLTLLRLESVIEILFNAAKVMLALRMIVLWFGDLLRRWTMLLECERTWNQTLGSIVGSKVGFLELTLSLWTIRPSSRLTRLYPTTSESRPM